jgi:predicted double-glycine peptidase
MHALAGIIILICLASSFYPEKGIPEKNFDMRTGYRDQIHMVHEVRPLSEFKFRNIAKQQYDFSCGSAALATIMRYQLGENLDEFQVIKGLMKYGDKEQIAQAQAFSLWDMKAFLEALGYSGDGYQASEEEKEKELKTPENWPCIVPIKLFGYKHFVVLKGVYQDHVFIADPWTGNSSFTLQRFFEMWDDNIMFIVSTKGKKTSKLLKLHETDLRFIDRDMTRTFVKDRYDQTADFDRQRAADSSGDIMIYKK